MADKFHSIDPTSLLLHHSSAADHPTSLALTPDTFSFSSVQRGPRYRAYAELRESKLRLRNAMYRDAEQTEKPTPPPKKQVKFVASETVVRKRSAAVAQSVPDFSAALRKENRRPPPGLSPVMEMTPPGKTWGKNIGGLSANSRGSKSASAGEKRGGAGGGLAEARRSYSGFEELKGFSTAAANAINGESRRGGGGRRGKTVLGVRQI